MRDLRHIAKYFYLMADNRFYLPFERAHCPSDEYASIVRELTSQATNKWYAVANGFWFHAHPDKYEFPSQGWKIHVSAMVSNSVAILRKVVPILVELNVAFKCSVDPNVLSLMSSKGWDRGGSGKFMTIYPRDVNAFKEILERLYIPLRHDVGPYVLSDKRYKDCSVLYYRYGGIRSNALLKITGLRSLVISDPSGAFIPDVRTPFFNPPEWAVDPFQEDVEVEDEGAALKDGRYIVTEAVSFSNTGGVYFAMDQQTGAKVVIKEARADVAVDRNGVDAIGRLKKEYRILHALADTGIAPQPLDAFEEWEHYFIVEEFIDGVDIRGIMLTQSPVLKVDPLPEDSQRFYEVYAKLFTSFLSAMEQAHSRGIVLNDVSATNLKIDPVTYEVRLIDFEGAFQLGIDLPSLLYTPGFRNPISGRDVPSTFTDDFYGVAAIMLYTMFPIAAMSSIKPDLYESVLAAIVQDVGWSTSNVFAVINGLSKGVLSSERAIELLEKAPVSCTPVFGIDVGATWCDDIVNRFAGFLLANMRPGSADALFPTDPFAYETNLLGLGFGACGTLYALKKCGFEAPKAAQDWLERRLDQIEPNRLVPGLLTGTAGMAWCLWELGLHDRAIAQIESANRNAFLDQNHSMLYGAAGVGMANLFFYSRTGNHRYLAQANAIADMLLASANVDERGRYWTHEDKTWLGYGYGQSGVALFLLRIHQFTGRTDVLEVGKAALAFDLSYAVEHEPNVHSFHSLPDSVTLEPYLEVGSAGIAKVAMRYGMLKEIEPLLRDLWRKYSVFPGLIFGLGGFVDVLTDAYTHSNETRFLDMSKRPLAGIRDLYVIDQPEGAAVPGDGLFRITCDYATGSAGVMRAIHRHNNRDESDFTLDRESQALSRNAESMLVLS